MFKYRAGALCYVLQGVTSQDNLKLAVFCKFITCIIFSLTEEKKLPLDIKGKQPQSSNLNWQLLLIQKLKEMVFKACFSKKVSKIDKFWDSLRNLLKMGHKKLEIQNLEGCIALSCCKTSTNLCQCIPTQQCVKLHICCEYRQSLSFFFFFTL